MGKVIYHPKDSNLYVEWSSVVDAPTAWGTFDEMLRYLIEDSREKKEYARPEAVERLSRARDTGTSSPNWRLPDTLSFQNTGTFPFEDLEYFIESYHEGKYDLSLLTKYEDDDE